MHTINQNKEYFQYYSPRIRQNSCLYDSFFGLYGGLPFVFTEEVSLNYYDEKEMFIGHDIIEFFDEKIAKTLVNEKISLVKKTRNSFNFLHHKQNINIKYHNSQNTSNILGESRLGKLILGSSSIFFC